jgi:cell division protein FtsZ
MNKIYQFFDKFNKKELKEKETEVIDLFDKIFLDDNIDFCMRLLPHPLANNDIDQILEHIQKQEKVRQEKDFLRFHIYADGMHLYAFEDKDRSATHYFDISTITALLEVIGESYAHEKIALGIFAVPSIYDPDCAESDMEFSICHKNIEIQIEFKFAESENLKVKLEIIKLPSYMMPVADIAAASEPKPEYRFCFDPLALVSEPCFQRTEGLYFSFVEEPLPCKAKIKIVGVGGGGGNVVNRIIESGVRGIEFITVNTDVQALDNSKAPTKIQLGTKLTQGLGTGSNPLLGREAALQDTDKILQALEGADMVFVTAGLGGGTGTGAAPIIASLARSLDILTVGVVTKPFFVEGRKRMTQAEQGVSELRKCADTVITIPNSRLRAVKERISIMEAFRRADDVLLQAIQGISDLITVPGLINLDFADIRTVMKNRGVGLLGFGEARGKGAAVNAMKSAIESKFLDEYSIKGATSILTNIRCSRSTPLDDIEEAVAMMAKTSGENTDIYFGTSCSDLEEYVSLMFIATGDLAFSKSCFYQNLSNTTYSKHEHRSNEFCFFPYGNDNSRFNLMRE